MAFKHSVQAISPALQQVQQADIVVCGRGASGI
jgi:hypothetical protein